jgi:hypothetical protein
MQIIAGIPKSAVEIAVNLLRGKNKPVYPFVKYNKKKRDKLIIAFKNKNLKAFLLLTAKITIKK